MQGVFGGEKERRLCREGWRKIQDFVVGIEQFAYYLPIIWILYALSATHEKKNKKKCQRGLVCENLSGFFKIYSRI
jgi:hypothetical protein